jgi:DNA-binding IclR family transcriptional regulator
MALENYQHFTYNQNSLKRNLVPYFGTALVKDEKMQQKDLKTVHRAFEILLYLSSSSEPRSFTDIRTALGLGKATTHRFLASLEELGMLKRDLETAKYRLGLTALRIGIAAGNQIELRKDMRPFLQELTERTGETSNLAVLESTKPVFIDNVESPKSLRMFSRVGRHTFPYCTAVGKALLAYQRPELLGTIFENEPFIQHTSASIRSREAFLEELARVRELGYAVDNEEGEAGARCVGAPIFNHLGQVIAAISVSSPSARIAEEQLPQLGEIVREVASRASASGH